MFTLYVFEELRFSSQLSAAAALFCRSDECLQQNIVSLLPSPIGGLHFWREAASRFVSVSQSFCVVLHHVRQCGYGFPGFCTRMKRDIGGWIGVLTVRGGYGFDDSCSFLEGSHS